MTPPYRAAVIGLGAIGATLPYIHNQSSLDHAQTHAATYHHHPKVTLMGGYDDDASACARFSDHWQLPAYDSLDAMLHERPHIVSICSPAASHPELLTACIAAGVRMVWLEKPLAPTLTDAEAMARAAEQDSVTVLVNFCRRYAPAYRALREMVGHHTHGTPKHLTITYSRGLMENGSHLLDQLCWMAEDSASLTVSHAWAGSDARHPSALLHLTLPDHQIVPVSLTGIASIDYHTQELLLYTDRGRVGLCQQGYHWQHERRIDNPDAPGFYRLNHSTSPDVPTGFIGCFANALDDLIAAHQEQRLPVSSLSSALEGMRLMQQIQETSTA